MGKREGSSNKDYVVKGCNPIYYAQDVHKSVKWFKEVLGWYGKEEGLKKDKQKSGFVYSEFSKEHSPDMNTGICILQGVVDINLSFTVKIKGIEEFYEHVTSKGWYALSNIIIQPDGVKMCTLKTIDDHEIAFFEE